MPQKRETRQKAGGVTQISHKGIIFAVTDWQQQLSSSARDQDIFERLRRVLSRFVEIEAFLLQADVNERAISHKLAEYLSSEFSDWDVDCEYNRDGHDNNPKRVYLEPVLVKSDDTEGTTVYPDIIVHKRGEPDNLLAIEIKKATSQVGEERDFKKLNAYRDQLGYRHALFVSFDTGQATCDVAKAVFV
jgi:hypothetical protein